MISVTVRRDSTLDLKDQTRQRTSNGELGRKINDVLIGFFDVEGLMTKDQKDQRLNLKC